MVVLLVLLVIMRMKAETKTDLFHLFFHILSYPLPVDLTTLLIKWINSKIYSIFSTMTPKETDAARASAIDSYNLENYLRNDT